MAGQFADLEVILPLFYWTALPPKEELEKKIHNLFIAVKERIERKKVLE